MNKLNHLFHSRKKMTHAQVPRDDRHGSKQSGWRYPALLAGTALATLISVQAAAVAPGNPAPAFTLTTLDGKPVALADLKGKWVALEWTNPDCPFVQKHYDSDNMQATQRVAADKKVVWVQVNSTNPGHKDFKSTKQMNEWLLAMKAVPTHAALDQSGAVGKAYGAKTTPHMYLINPGGQIVYNGAIDDKRSANPADIPGARNHMKEAITEAVSGKPVTIAATTPYGCSIKY
jgi:peroxiredoxin